MRIIGTTNALDADDQRAVVDEVDEVDEAEAEADECNAALAEEDVVDVGIDMSAAKSEWSDAANTRSASWNGANKMNDYKKSL